MRSGKWKGALILAAFIAAIALPRVFTASGGEPALHKNLHTLPARLISGTDAGEHGIWQPEAYSHVHIRDADIKSWERELADEAQILLRIRQGQFIPISEHSDGSIAIDFRRGNSDSASTLTEAERACVTQYSKSPYLFISNGRAYVSGIEYIDANPDDTVEGILLPKGNYAVSLFHLGCENGPASMPNYIVVFNPKPEAGTKFRIDVETFDSASIDEKNAAALPGHR